MHARARPLEPFLYALPAALLAAVAVRVGYATEPFVPLVALLALCGLALAFWRPKIALVASVALVPLELFALPLGGFALSPSEAMFSVTALAWALRRFAEGGLPLSPSPLGKPLALLVLALLPGLLVAEEIFPILKIVGMWTAFFLLYQMTVAEGDVSLVRWVLLGLGVAGAIVGVIALVRLGGQEQELIGFGEIAENRAVGSFQQANTLASFIALALPGALALGVRGPVAWRPVALAAFFCAFAGLALSLSRGGVFAAAAAVLVMLAWAPVRRLATVAVLAVLAVAIVTPNPLGDVQQVDTARARVESVSYSAQSRTDPRFGIWKASLQIFQDNPLTGIGAANFEAVSPRYGLVDTSTGLPADHGHNLLLTFAAELGVLSMLALAWLVVALGKVLVRACRSREGPERGLAFAITAALVAFGVHGLVDYTLRTNVIAAVVVVLAGCAVVLGRPSDPAPATGR